mgnify:CR=1 FL=1
MNITRTSKIAGLLSFVTAASLSLSGCTASPEPQPQETSDNRSASIGSALLLMCVSSASPRTLVWGPDLITPDGTPLVTTPIDISQGYDCAMNKPLLGSAKVTFTVDGKSYTFWRGSHDKEILWKGFPTSDLNGKYAGMETDSDSVGYRRYDDATIYQESELRVHNGYKTRTVTLDFN